jgi:peroxiredoxin
MTRILSVAALLTVLAVQAYSSGDFQIDAEAISKLSLQAPENEKERAYLGLRGNGPFSLTDIKTPVVLLQVFSMYCPICQADAPNANRLFERISGDPALKEKVRMIGIGTGNTPFEVGVFKKKYSTPFPLVPDDDLAVQKACSQPIRTPTYVWMKKTDSGLKQVGLHLGPIENIEDFLKTMKSIE